MQRGEGDQGLHRGDAGPISRECMNTCTAAMHPGEGVLPAGKRPEHRGQAGRRAWPISTATTTAWSQATPRPLDCWELGADSTSRRSPSQLMWPSRPLPLLSARVPLLLLPDLVMATTKKRVRAEPGMLQGVCWPVGPAWEAPAVVVARSGRPAIKRAARVV